MNIAILGAMWGDEGKGHITHHLSKDYDWVIRFNGGANAGHTIYRDGVKYVHNLLPSIDWRNPNAKAYLGAGMVIDLEKLRDEVYDADDAFPGAAKRIYVDKNAFLVLDKYKEEDKKTNAHIGSTNRGIGPAYKAKIGRQGVRIDDLWRRDSGFHDPYYNDFMYQLCGRGVHFVNLPDMHAEMTRSKLLYEGAQGVLLDINHGLYPYVSCSDCTVGGIYSSGFHFAPPKRIYGVAKCYTTKVGEGPFPTEIEGKEAEELRVRGKEYGATTGRPRRVGWLDLPALNYACRVSGITDLILTKFDILEGMSEVPVCVKYKGLFPNKSEPTSPSDFRDPTLEYTKLPGWSKAETTNKELAGFIRQVEKATSCNVNYISVGTETTDILPWYDR